jgi:hypothetical protein
VKRTVHFERLPTVSAPGPGVDEPPTKSTPILSVPFHGTVTITNAKRQDDNSIMCYTATFRGFFAAGPPCTTHSSLCVAARANAMRLTHIIVGGF